MRLFGDPKVFRGSIAWTKPLRLKIAVLPRPSSSPLHAPPGAVTEPPPQQAEYDEDGRLWVFRYACATPRTYQVDRSRIFAYMKRHRLPSESVRQIRRDQRNAIDLYSAVRELQTHAEIDTTVR